MLQANYDREVADGKRTVAAAGDRIAQLLIVPFAAPAVDVVAELPDGGDAILVEGQAPYPAPFLDLRAGRTNETWQPFGATVDDTAGNGPPEQRLREQDMDGLLAEVLFPNTVPPFFDEGASALAAASAFGGVRDERFCGSTGFGIIRRVIRPWPVVQRLEVTQ